MAIELRDWLITQGWSKSQIFLDLDDLHSGTRWRDQLNEFGAACEAVIVCLSDEWLTSLECVREFNHAESLGKAIFPIVVSPITLPIPRFITDIQMADISKPDIATSGYDKLKAGLTAARIEPGQFAWPPPGEPERAPYRGLSALDVADAAIFFGRDMEITRGLDAIRRLRGSLGQHGAPRVLAILGASGAGKSSFLRAGLLARLQRNPNEYLVLPILRPGSKALTGACGILNSLGMKSEDDDLATIVEKLRLSNEEREPDEANPPEPTIILPIDQAEELFAHGDAESEKAIALIERMLALEPNLILMLSIRSDQFSLLQENRILGPVPRIPFDLPPIGISTLKEIISGPGKLCDPIVKIEDALVQRLIDDLGDHGSLPLLAFTLERLFLKFGASGDISTTHYDEDLGGIEGAIDAAVEAAFASARQDPDLPNSRSELEEMARALFIPALVKIEAHDAAAKRAIADKSTLSGGEIKLLEHFVSQRLLTANMIDGVATYEVTHEAVLRYWPTLCDWIEFERVSLVRLDRLRVAALAYKNDPTDENIVHRGEALKQLDELRSRPEFSRELSSDIRKYLDVCDAEEEQSEAQAAKTRLLSRVIPITGAATIAGLIGIVFAVNLLASGFSNWRASSLVPAANRAAELGQNDLALRLAIAAVPPPGAIAPTNADALAMLQLSSATRAARNEPDYRQIIKAAAFDTKSNYVFLGDNAGNIIRLSLDAPDPFSSLQLGTETEITAMTVSPSGDWLGVASRNGSMHFWRLPKERFVTIAPDPACEIKTSSATWRSLAFNKDETKVVIAGAKRLTGQAAIGLFNLQDCALNDIDAASLDTQPLQVEWRNDGLGFTVLDLLWRLRSFDFNGVMLTPEAVPAFAKACAEFDCDRSVRPLYSFSTDSAAFRRSGEVEVYNGTSASVYSRPDPCTDRNETGPEAQISLATDARFQRLLIMCDDGRLFSWQEPRAPVLVETAAAFSTMSNSGRFAADFGFDGKLRLTDFDNGADIVDLPEDFKPSAVTAMAVSDTGQIIAIATKFKPRNEQKLTHRLFLFDTENNQLRSISDREGAITRLRFNAQNTHLLASGWDERVCIHDAVAVGGDNRAQCFGETGMAGTDAAWSPDGASIATIGNRSAEPVIWDVKSGALVSPEQLGRGNSPLWFVNYAPNNEYLVAGGERGILRYWKISHGDDLALEYEGALVGHASTVLEAAFDPNVERIVSLGADRTVRVWDLKSFRNIATAIFPARNVAWSAAGISLAGQEGVSALVDISNPAGKTRQDACLRLGDDARSFSSVEFNRFPALRPGDCNPCENIGAGSFRYWFKSLSGGDKQNACRPA